MMFAIGRFATSLRPVLCWPLFLQPAVLVLHLLAEVLWFVAALIVVALRIALATVGKVLFVGGLAGKVTVGVALWLVKLAS